MNKIPPDIAELLALRATEGLNTEQAEELARLLEQHGMDDTDEFDLAAAAAGNAFCLENAAAASEVPDNLKAKLQRDADRFFSRQQDNVVELRQPRPRISQWNWGWATAAALALILVATNIVDFDAPANFAADRDRLVADVDGTVVVPWATPEDPEFVDVVGDVVWNNDRQEGYMLLSGMPVNDPSAAQYQLWVVDAERYAHPVDGGVFDIPADASSVVIPIDAKLAVSNPTVFAITREQPGGVVVSQGPLLVVASTG